MKLLPKLVALQAAVLITASAATTPLRIEQTVEPRFPAALSISTIAEGEASIVINVDADGRLADLLVSSFSDRAFANEAVAVLRQWRYQPATEDGKPVGSRMQLDFKFNAIGRVISITSMDTANTFMGNLGKRSLTSLVVTANQLDRSPVPVESISPRNPRKAGDPTAKVLIDFYIDEAGLPRMPVVLKAPDLTVASLAVNALNQWRFSPPTHQGRPVSVRVQQEFIFPANS